MEFKLNFNGADKKGECICNSTDHEAELWQKNFEKVTELVEWFSDHSTKSRETADAIANAIITFCNAYATKEKTYAEDVKRRHEDQWRYEEERRQRKAEEDAAKRAKDLR